MMMVGSLAAVTLANQFGFDGTAYTAHLVAAVPGRAELRSRAVAFSLFVVPLLLLATLVSGAVVGRPDHLPAMLGGALAVYGVGLAVNLGVSVFAAYPLPENANPFAVNTGAGVAKSLLAMGTLVGAQVLCAPIVVAAVLLAGSAGWLLLPLGVAYGAGAAWLGVHAVGAVIDRRGPQLLAAVTPRR